MDWAVNQINDKIFYLNTYCMRASMEFSISGYSGKYVQPIPQIPKLKKGAIQNTFDLNTLVELVKLALKFPPLYDAEINKDTPSRSELWEIREGLESASINIAKVVNEMQRYI